MTALAQNLGSTYGAKFGTVQTYKVGAGAHIYRFGTVALQNDGYLYPAIEDISDANKQIVVGVAQEEMDNSSGASGAKNCRVRREGRIKRMYAGSATQTVVGKLACIQDDQTVQLYGVSTTQVVMGRITEIFTTSSVYVDMIQQHQRLATDAND